MSKSPLYSSLIISSPSRRRSTQYQYLLRLNTYMCSLFFFFYIFVIYTLRWINASMWVPLKKIYERTVEFSNENLILMNSWKINWNCCWKNLWTSFYRRLLSRKGKYALWEIEFQENINYHFLSIIIMHIRKKKN